MAVFTGIVESIGTIKKVDPADNSIHGKTFLIEAFFHEGHEPLRKGESISLNGVCQTVKDSHVSKNRFTVYASSKTLAITTLDRLHKGSHINVERSMRLGERLSGHMVYGHIDTTAKIINLKEVHAQDCWMVRIAMTKEHAPFLVRKGAITVDGVSLTVYEVGLMPDQNVWVDLMLIRQTLEMTTLQYWKVGLRVNVELDVVGKYLQKHIGQSLQRGQA